jgi:hypothetical protein
MNDTKNAIEKIYKSQARRTILEFNSFRKPGAAINSSINLCNLNVGLTI